MNRWAARHADALQRELEPGEQLLAAHRVQLAGAESASVVGSPDSDAEVPVRWGGRGAPPARRSMKRRVEHAHQLGFDVPSGIFVLGLSDRRIIMWEATPGMARPVRLASSIPLAEIAAVPIVRRWGSVRLVVLRDDQSMLVVQPLWSRRLRDLSAAFDAAT